MNKRKIAYVVAAMNKKLDFVKSHDRASIKRTANRVLPLIDMQIANGLNPMTAFKVYYRKFIELREHQAPITEDYWNNMTVYIVSALYVHELMKLGADITTINTGWTGAHQSEVEV